MRAAVRLANKIERRLRKFEREITRPLPVLPVPERLRRRAAGIEPANHRLREEWELFKVEMAPNDNGARLEPDVPVTPAHAPVVALFDDEVKLSAPSLTAEPRQASRRLPAAPNLAAKLASMKPALALVSKRSAPSKPASDKSALSEVLAAGKAIAEKAAAKRAAAEKSATEMAVAKRVEAEKAAAEKSAAKKAEAERHEAKRVEAEKAAAKKAAAKKAAAEKAEAERAEAKRAEAEKAAAKKAEAEKAEAKKAAAKKAAVEKAGSPKAVKGDAMKMSIMASSAFLLSFVVVFHFV